MRDWWAHGVALVAAMLMLGATCQEAHSDAAGAACVSALAALELRCVDQASTREEADRCRAAVRAAHECIDGGSHD